MSRSRHLRDDEVEHARAVLRRRGYEVSVAPIGRERREIAEWFEEVDRVVAEAVGWRACEVGAWDLRLFPEDETTGQHAVRLTFMLQPRPIPGGGEWPLFRIVPEGEDGLLRSWDAVAGEAEDIRRVSERYGVLFRVGGDAPPSVVRPEVLGVYLAGMVLNRVAEMTGGWDRTLTSPPYGDHSIPGWPVGGTCLFVADPLVTSSDPLTESGEFLGAPSWSGEGPLEPDPLYCAGDRAEEAPYDEWGHRRLNRIGPASVLTFASGVRSGYPTVEQAVDQIRQALAGGLMSREQAEQAMGMDFELERRRQARERSEVRQHLGVQLDSDGEPSRLPRDPCVSCGEVSALVGGICRSCIGV